ncbi:zinc finger MYM-type protein 1-like [Panicum virgatum]|uniref:zinc finger MYM-type protein 1-like n=1 Tax=Panicum virgatum TaxID=38727 RepID=UPI0019D66F1B|nr:zinc finger MYM-type protein 1-like [Panicum virgatum]
MQIVIFQGQSTSGSGRNTIPLEAERDEQQQQPPANPSIIKDDESMPIDESDSGDVDDSNYNIEHDPGLRPPISSYPVKYCFVCYLFKDSSKYPGGDAFVNEGFRNWNMKCRIRRHVGAINSAHNEAEEKYNLFMKPRTSIRESIGSNSAYFKAQYLARLTWSLKCIRYLLRQGLAFRGHNEGKDSNNQGNFRELLAWLAGNFEEVNMVVLENAPHNCQMIDHKIQKQLIAACAHETTKFIIEELGDECFAILADESSDAYQQEQLALCLRYVNKNGEPVERFLGLVHVEDTTSLTLKQAIQSLLIKYQLPLSKIRGQGYDGASNMKGHVNGLKKLIMEESSSAYYTCLARKSACFA